MKFNYLKLFVLAAGIFLAHPALGEELFWYEGNKVHVAELAPAAVILGLERNVVYQELLEQKKCYQAMKLLNTAFREYYPQYAEAVKPYGRHYNEWRAFVVRENFHALAYCKDLTGFEAKERDIARTKTAVGPFLILKLAGKPKPPEYGRLWRDRDEYLVGFLSLAFDGYHEVLLKLAEIVRRGDIFEAGPEAEYYLLRRACHFGVDCAAHGPRIAELEKLVPGNVQKDMAKRAAAKEFDFKAVSLD